MSKLTEADVRILADLLPDWQVLADHGPTGDGAALFRSFRFLDFNAAFGFMTRIALLAERMDHHPDWSNSYNRVDIALATHDAGGLTSLDRDMAVEIDRLYLATKG